MLKFILKQNFLLYPSVPISRSCDEYPASSSAPAEIVSLKKAKKQKFLRVAIATVIHKAMKFGTWIALNELYILCHYTIALSLIALTLGPKMSFFVDFGPFSPGYHSNQLTSQLLAGNIFVWRQGLHDQCI